MFAPRAMQFRLALSAIDRDLDVNTKLVVTRRPEETMAHVVLRVLAYGLFYRADLAGDLRFALGPADRDSPDLWAHDLVGRPVEWIICGDVDVEELRHVLQHQRQAKVRVLFGADEERERFFQGLRSSRRRLLGLAAVDFRQIDSKLVDGLATRDLERQRWAMTCVEDHVYVDADGLTTDGEVVQVALPADVESAA
jgi:uncharacterized protein YaeQ